MAIVIPNPNLNNGVDEKDQITIGLKLPLESGKVGGNFESTSVTIDAVKENIKSLIKTEKGERVMQPNLGLGLKVNLFENFNDELRYVIDEDIRKTFAKWLPFVNVTTIDIEQDELEQNRINLLLKFFITSSPNHLHSVNISI